MGDRSIFEVEREDVERFLDGRSLSARSRHSWLSHLHCFYQWAIDNELTAKDPAARIPRPKIRRTLPRPASTKELRRAVEAAPPVLKCWMLLAACQGLRCQEIAGLRREDVLEDDGLLRIVHGKGGHERIMPLHPEVLEALQALPLPKTGVVFERPMGGPYHPHGLSRRFNAGLLELHVNATAHQLRHWFGTQLYATSKDLRLTQEMLGHASPQTTAIYTAFDRTAAVAAVRSLGLAQTVEAD